MDSAREAELLEIIRQKDEEIARLRSHVVLLEQKIDLLVRRIFGASSEKLNAAQLELLLNPESAKPSGKDDASGAELEASLPATSDEESRAKRRHHAPRLPDDLPIIEEVIDPQEVSADPSQWRCIDEEVTEQLDYEPARFFRRRLRRRKYVKRSDGYLAPIIAPLPPRLQERCLAAPGLLAQLIVAKYCDHLPLYRLESIFAQRHGVHLPRQTLARWLTLAAEWLKPVYQQLRTGVMAGGYVQIDETPIEYLAPGHGRTKLGYLWTCNRPGGEVIYQWHTSRASACLDDLVSGGFQGIVQCDGYTAYDSFAGRSEGRVQLAGCWAHVRRKFFDARKQAPQQAGWLLRQIGHLYRIEAGLRKIKAGPRLRAAVRASQSQPIIRRIGKALIRLQMTHKHLPKSAMGKALSYALNQWSSLSVFIDHGQIEIDQNLVENAIRPTAIGKKNWMCVSRKEAADVMRKAAA